MFTPGLPLHTVDAWELRLLFEEGEDVLHVKAIEARGGLVIGAGAPISVLRPGETRWRGHEAPPGGQPLHLVAVEPHGERRYAVASAETFTMFVKGEGADEIVGSSSTKPGAKVTHMAWAGVADESALFVLRDDHVLLRIRSDRSGVEALEIEPLHAIASDERGGVAMVSLSGHRPRVLLASNDLHWKARALDVDISPSASVQMAVAGTAVALVVDETYVLLSRAREEPFVRVPALDLGKGEHGWRVGPVAFQGDSRDAALLCARSEDDLVRVVRVDPEGAAMSIVELAGTESRDAPDILSLSWDASRQTLWGATSDAGILRLSPPEAKGRKRVVLS